MCYFLNFQRHKRHTTKTNIQLGINRKGMFHTTKYGGKVYKLYKFHQSLSLISRTSKAAIHIHKSRVYRTYEDTIQTMNLKTEPNTIILLDFIGLYSNTTRKWGTKKLKESD